MNYRKKCHRSTAVRSYKCPSEDLLQNISNALQPPKPKERKPSPKKERDTEHSPQTVEQTPTWSNVLYIPVVPDGVDSVCLDRSVEKLLLRFERCVFWKVALSLIKLIGCHNWNKECICVIFSGGRILSTNQRPESCRGLWS